MILVSRIYACVGMRDIFAAIRGITMKDTSIDEIFDNVFGKEISETEVQKVISGAKEKAIESLQKLKEKLEQQYPDKSARPKKVQDKLEKAEKILAENK
mgnify:CR=1 FL=1